MIRGYTNERARPLSPTQVHELTAPMRNARDPEFADFVDSVGEDTSGNRINPHPFLHHSTEINDVHDHIFPDPVLSRPSECLT